MSYEQQASIIDVTGHAGLAMRSLARSADAKIAEQAAEIERLRRAMAACASLTGQDWLTGQLALAEALDATYGTENLDYVLGRYATLTPPQGDSDE